MRTQTLKSEFTAGAAVGLGRSAKMKLSKPIVIGVILLGIGGFTGWTLRPVVEGIPSLTLAGTVDCEFSAEVTWHPETKIEGENAVMHETTWKWVFHNRSDTPIQFSIPNQELHVNRSIYGYQFTELPKSMLVDPPVSIAPGERKEYSARSGSIRGHGHKPRKGDYGFEIVAEIDGLFRILGCAANVREAPKAEQSDALNPGSSLLLK